MGAGSSSRRRNHHPSAPPPQYSSSAPYPPHGSYVFAANAPYPVPYPHPADPYPPPHAYHPSHYYHHASSYSNPINTSMVLPVGGRQNYTQSNGSWSYGMRPSPWAGAPPPPISPPPYVEQQKATTIRNDVNLKKETLRLERDEDDPDRYLVAFTFDSMVSGSISIFFFAKEGSSCSLTVVKPHCTPIRVPFAKGLGQKFRQPSGTGIDLSLFGEVDLTKEGPDEVFPLVIRAESCSTSHSVDASYVCNQKIGNPLPKSVNAQITQAVIEKKDSGEYRVKVVKQILWADGIRYELQEIYGIGSSTGTDFDGSDPGKECVICMSEPRDTTVLPCRHMCMCSECAKVLRFQTNRCPICRRPVERLMEIKVNKTEV